MQGTESLAFNCVMLIKHQHRLLFTNKHTHTVKSIWSFNLNHSQAVILQHVDNVAQGTKSQIPILTNMGNHTLHVISIRNNDIAQVVIKLHTYPQRILNFHIPLYLIHHLLIDGFLVSPVQTCLLAIVCRTGYLHRYWAEEIVKIHSKGTCQSNMRLRGWHHLASLILRDVRLAHLAICA